MKSRFEANFFSGNRKKLKGLVKDTDLFVLAANGRLQSSSDQTFSFRQDSNFRYMTGIDEPDVLLVMDKSGEYLIASKTDEALVRYEGGVDFESLTARSGVKQVVESDAGWQKLEKSLKSAKSVATIEAPPDYIESRGFYTNPAKSALIKQIKSTNSKIKIIDLKSQLANMRMIKQPEELDTLKSAIDVTIKTFMSVKSRLGEYKSENEVEADIARVFRKNKSKFGYDPMVAFGINACTAHSFSNDAPFKGEGLLMIDAGAEVDRYTADITRTYALKKPTRRQLEVHAAVEELLEYALSLVKPGASVKHNERLVEKAMGEQLKKLGLVKKLERGKIRYYYPHATSHFLGLDVHDAGDYEAPLAPGMVITVEPGIYIPEEKIGIRLEENVLITNNGYVNLSAGLPRRLS